ncbi:hypothetical protein [Streptomyces aidingensis]|uniref:Histidine kinase-, DNA gyrase B-, and HSP90-like ATPase n=1 Tax=Streptomyces aidingensis TaxID=910347 RepID=A0A1I1GS24_9ACTN|nr:hypothetical protein [Streptomyces aidingensis]SFC14286.1 hypothetical protein SAMN05421773_102110 [Streptomyces aidingensis]
MHGSDADTGAGSRPTPRPAEPLPHLPAAARSGVSTPESSAPSYGVALRAGTSLWRAGVYFRAACVAGMWLLLVLPGAAAGQPLRAVAQLSVTSAAVLLAHLHTRLGTLERLTGARLSPARRLAAHLLGVNGRATMDASGFAETAGALSALWLFTGPLPVPGLSPGIRIAGIVLGVLYSLSAAAQAMIDAGWYSPYQPPSRGLRRLRPLLPLVFSGMLVAYLFPYNGTAGVLPVPWYAALCATPLLYYPMWACYEVLLRAAAADETAHRAVWRQESAVALHSISRNSLSLLRQYLDEPDPDPQEVRRLVREAMLQAEEARLDIQYGSDRADPHRFGELWELVLRTFPAPQQDCCTTDADSARLSLGPVDYQIARRVLPDLLTNAFNAGARRIEVSCALRDASGTAPPTVCLTVRDNGPGVAEDPAAGGPPHRSSRLLRHWLTVYGGELTWRPAAAAGDVARNSGTVASAHWRAQDSGDRGTRSPAGEEQVQPPDFGESGQGEHRSCESW